MKKLFRKKSSLIVLGIAFAAIVMAGFPAFSRFFSPAPPPPDPQYLLNERAAIIGTFISEQDPNSMMVFGSNSKCYDYYNGSLVGVSTYSLTNSTPQCGTNVLVDESKETSYLTLINDNDGTIICYEINGITSLLSLTTVVGQKLITLTRQ